MRTTKRLLAVFGFGLLLAAGAASAYVGPLSGLTAQWWQFVTSIPTSVNPGLDQTGADCLVGQGGPVWFLVGTFTNGPVTRTCSVPEGAWLLFPVVNEVNINTPNVCRQNSANQNVGVLGLSPACVKPTALLRSTKASSQTSSFICANYYGQYFDTTDPLHGGGFLYPPPVQPCGQRFGGTK